jgi:hypothetical protein
MRNKLFLVLIVLFFNSCDNPKILLDQGNGITIEFFEGLNDNPEFQLTRDSNGYYELELDKNRNQTIQRISGKLLRYGRPVEDISIGSQPKNIDFSSNLYWWLLEGDTVSNITYTYLNEFTGELTYVNLPPLVNWKEVIVPTINSSGYSDPETGVFNTVIAPIREMVGDTMKIKVEYTHTISSKEEGSMFFEILGGRIFKDSTYIIIK